MTRFRLHQYVRATASTQGLIEGTVYRVTRIREQRTAFGTFVAYQLDFTSTWIENGHLLLTEADNPVTGGGDPR